MSAREFEDSSQVCIVPPTPPGTDESMITTQALEATRFAREDLRNNLRLYQLEGIIPFKPKNSSFYEDSVGSLLKYDDNVDKGTPSTVDEDSLGDRSLSQRRSTKGVKGSRTGSQINVFEDYEPEEVTSNDSTERNTDRKMAFETKWIRDPRTGSVELMMNRRSGSDLRDAIPLISDSSQVEIIQKRERRKVLPYLPDDQLEVRTQ